MSAQPKPKKVRNPAVTRARILDAAQRAFSELGYAAVGIRDIAERANVSLPSLFAYFGSKIGLFEEALKDAVAMAPVLQVERTRFGEHLIESALTNEVGMRSMSMVVLATAAEESREVARSIVEDSVLAPLAEWLGPPNARERAIAISILCDGFTSQFIQFGIRPQPITADHPIAKWVSKSIQAIVDGADGDAFRVDKLSEANNFSSQKVAPKHS